LLIGETQIQLLTDCLDRVEKNRRETEVALMKLSAEREKETESKGFDLVKSLGNIDLGAERGRGSCFKQYPQ